MPKRFFTARRIRGDVLRRPAGAWASITPLSGALPDTGEVWSLGDQYYLSLSAHVHHTPLLLADPSAPRLTPPGVLKVCALISFILDEPIVPIARQFRGSLLDDEETYSAAFSPLVDREFEGYLDALGGAATQVSTLFTRHREQRFRFVQPKLAGSPTHWTYTSLPTTQKTWRLLMVYWSGLLSILPTSRLLNFWRVFESYHSTSATRQLAAYQQLPNARPRPVPYEGLPNGRATRFNRALALAQFAIGQHERLRRTHGSDEAALNHIRFTRRGKAAHADQSAMEYDQLADLGLQLQEAELVRFMARLSLDELLA